jgi:hypothetical protein
VKVPLKSKNEKQVNHFIICSKCGEKWETRDQFLAAHDIQLIGYQVNFRNLELGLFLFNHLSCRTTLALRAGNFKDMHRGEIFRGKKTGTNSCPNYCLNSDDLNACPAKCECAYVRDIIQKIKTWPKLLPTDIKLEVVQERSKSRR